MNPLLSAIVSGMEIRSAIRPGDLHTAPLRIVLHESNTSSPEHPEYVTHIQNMQSGGCDHGHYHRSHDAAGDYLAALRDYLDRCEQYDVQPFPPLDAQNIPAGLPR